MVQITTPMGNQVGKEPVHKVQNRQFQIQRRRNFNGGTRVFQLGTRSLFSPVYKSELNGEEQKVAVHLDGETAVKWWHRNVAKTNYGLQGWKRGRIYPDFIFATGGNAGSGRIVVMETKGDHLQNPDTDYKRDVMNFLTQSFTWNEALPAGQLQIQTSGETVECTLVLMEEIATKLPKLLAE